MGGVVYRKIVIFSCVFVFFFWVALEGVSAFSIDRLYRFWLFICVYVCVDVGVYRTM